MPHEVTVIEIGKPQEDDDMMDHVSLELMKAIETKDKESFKDSFEAMVSDIIYKLHMDMEMKEGPEEKEGEK